jgi:hypothetical protein
MRKPLSGAGSRLSWEPNKGGQVSLDQLVRFGEQTLKHPRLRLLGERNALPRILSPGDLR